MIYLFLPVIVYNLYCDVSLLTKIPNIAVVNYFFLNICYKKAIFDIKRKTNLNGFYLAVSPKSLHVEGAYLRET